MSPFQTAHVTSYSPFTDTILYGFQDIASYLIKAAKFFSYSMCIRWRRDNNSHDWQKSQKPPSQVSSKVMCEL